MGRRPTISAPGWLCRFSYQCPSLFAASLLGLAVCTGPVIPAEPPDEFLSDGERALAWTRRFVALGPRPAGSSALAEQLQMIRDGLEGLSCSVAVDAFVAVTPVGELPMSNVIARFGPPDAGEVIVISGHYDTLRKKGFVGANDGGSSAGLLMALAERLEVLAWTGVWLAFFDGEESTTTWRNLDHTYGSRRVAEAWAVDGTVRRIRGLINVDMIGDRDLELVYDGNSDAALRELVWTVATELGYRDEFGTDIAYIEDDHVPFLKVGVPSLNLIDFSYGPRNSYWHTTADTLDKLNSRSFATILHVLQATIGRLQAR